MPEPNLPNRNPQTLAIKLSKRAEQSVKSGHPWVFSEGVVKINKEGHSGDVAVVFSQSTNKVIGVGLYDPDSPIRIKMLHHGGGAKLDHAFFEAGMAKAKSQRTELLQSNTTSYRLIHGENDGFPSLVADVYDSVLVIKLYSRIWWPYLDLMIPIIVESSGVESVVLRLSRNVAKQHPQLEDGQVIWGQLKSPEVPFLEHGVTFSANVVQGHKTGFFLDHRANRKRVGELSTGKRVLDVFSYAGGFSVHALVGGAYKVTSVDISGPALKLAQHNAALNEYKGTHNCVEGDAFEVLEDLINQKTTFELVVIDPPSFAKQASEAAQARKKYFQLAQLGASLVAKNGILVLASCSSRILAADFFRINNEALKALGRAYEILEKTTHDIDHPIGFPEGAYLKCGYYRLY